MRFQRLTQNLDSTFGWCILTLGLILIIVGYMKNQRVVDFGYEKRKSENLVWFINGGIAIVIALYLLWADSMLNS